MDEHEAGEINRKADQATRLINDDVFNECFQNMNTQILEHFIASPPEATEERERLYHMYKAGQLFVTQFATMINTREMMLHSETGE